MEPTDLTCAQCGTSWKVIKAGEGPITCPNCKAPVGESPAPPVEPTPPVAVPAPAVTPGPPTLSAPAARRPRPTDDLSDDDDPGLAPRRRQRADIEPTRRRWHPLVIVGLVLLLLMLVPVALIALLFAVCAFSG